MEFVFVGYFAGKQPRLRRTRSCQGCSGEEWDDPVPQKSSSCSPPPGTGAAASFILLSLFPSVQVRAEFGVFRNSLGWHLGGKDPQGGLW